MQTKKLTAFRLNCELKAEVLKHTTNLTAAVEDGLRIWLWLKEGRVEDLPESDAPPM